MQPNGINDKKQNGSIHKKGKKKKKKKYRGGRNGGAELTDRQLRRKESYHPDMVATNLGQ